MVVRMACLAMLLVSGAACQQQAGSAVEGGEWRVEGPEVRGVAAVPAGPVAFGGDLGEWIQARGLSLEEFGGEVRLRTTMDLRAGDRIIPKGEYRLALMLGRGGASVGFACAGGEVPKGDGDAFAGMAVQSVEDPSPDLRVGWEVPDPDRAAARLQVRSGTTLLSLDVVAVPDLVEDRKLSKAALRILREAEQFTILTLKPEPHPPSEAPPEGGLFHGYGITGQARIRDRDAQSAIVEAIATGIGRSRGAVAACFNPRHGVRAFHRDRWVELVICYECLHMRVYGAARGPSQVVLTADVSREILPLFEREGLRVAGR